jgi:hypothetical protein
MRVIDFNGVHQAGDDDELEHVMSSRCEGGKNEFMLSHEPNEFPLLMILVIGDLAALYYIPRDGEAGFASVGADVESDEMTTFAIGDHWNAIEITNRAIVPMSAAIEAAKDYLHDARLPNAITWLAL